MKIASTVITSAAALTLIAAPAFAQSSGAGGSGASAAAGGAATASESAGTMNTVIPPQTPSPGTDGLGPGMVGRATSGIPGTGTNTIVGGGTVMPCVGVACSRGGVGDPNLYRGSR